VRHWNSILCADVPLRIYSLVTLLTYDLTQWDDEATVVECVMCYFAWHSGMTIISISLWNTAAVATCPDSFSRKEFCQRTLQSCLFNSSVSTRVSLCSVYCWVNTAVHADEFSVHWHWHTTAYTPLSRKYICVRACVVASALQYMRSKNVSHMDLKPQNILLSTTTSPILKIAGL